ncbi:recombinase family protein [Sphingomonas gilva]|uniref:Recombinase family protein n=1 Tax=Sphingomonas gilva TaxID=2305907 RepID=A0A396S423_9SPHN|nr:recombinase family protein [Sphingomonas gilva]RHW18165.1 recombinase family protein [Sphingomonas gilva]
MRTLIYARYSSQLQNSRSIEDQVRVCMERAASEGWQVVDTFSDAAIGGAAGTSKRQRPGMSALLARVEVGDIEQVLADTTSRIARNQGDAHHIRDRLNFCGARLFTLGDGEIDAFKGAIKGLLDEQQRKELAHNIKRAQRGRVAEGRAPAGLAYGYRTANRIDDRGRFIRGLREIDPDEAEVIRRIFREYAAGQSVRAIAERLNSDRIPGPRGGLWKGSTIIGGKKRGDGTLRNRLYVGELVHNRTSKVVEPMSRTVRIRPNENDTWLVQAVPELRIVEQNLWDRVQEQLEARTIIQPEQQRRPKHLLSGMGKCGVCGSGWIRIRSGFWGCAGVRDGAGCSNTRIISDDRYETRVLTGLQERLLDPDAVDLFVREYQEESIRRDREEGRNRLRLERKLATAHRQMNRLVDAIADGGKTFPQVKEKMYAAREEIAACTEGLAAIEGERVIALHPKIAADYRREVAALNRALKSDQTEETREEVIPRLRALIDSIVLTPAAKGRGVDIEIGGRLARMIELATGRPLDDQGMLAMERVRGIEPPS